MYISSVLSAALMAASAVTASPAMVPSRFVEKRGVSGGDQVVAYWGNTGASTGNIPLSQVCSNPDIDIVVLSFLTTFPEQASKGVPVLNFGNACGGVVFSDGLLHCTEIGPQITACQNAGKKVLLSLGGAVPGNQAFSTASAATSFADWLWGTFGPKQGSTYERPFDDAVVDGFDLDLEGSASQANFDSFISELRTNYLASGGTYYISAAPQCALPDAHFSEFIQTSWFDFIFVQLYNTEGCSAADFVANPSSSSNTFSKWLSGAVSTVPGYLNPATKVFAGLPASKDASTGDSSTGSQYWLTPNQVKTLVQDVYLSTSFGGISLWDATYDSQNQICGQSYSYWVKLALEQCHAGNFSPFPSACPSSSSSIASSTSSVRSSTSSYFSPTSSSSIHSSTSSQYIPSSSSHSSSSHYIPSSSSHSSSSHYIPSSSSHSSSSHYIPTSSKATTSSVSFPSHGPYGNSSTISIPTGGSGPRPSQSHGGGSGPRPSQSHGGGSGPLPGSSKGGSSGPKPTSSWGANGGSPPQSSVWGGYGGSGPHGKPTATQTWTSSWVDVCSTGYTTKTHTWTKTCYDGDSTTTKDIPDGWTTSVTVCSVCGPHPTTVTITKPWDTPAKPTDPAWGPEPTYTSTLVVVVTPVPASEYWSYVGKPAPTTPVAPVNASPKSSAAWGGADVGAVAGSPTSAASWALTTATGTGSYAAQFTGAASKMNVGFGLFGGLILAVLAAF